MGLRFEVCSMEKIGPSPISHFLLFVNVVDTGTEVQCTGVCRIYRGQVVNVDQVKIDILSGFRTYSI